MAGLKLNKNIVLLLGALVLGLIAALLSVSYIQKRVDEATVAAKVQVEEATAVVSKRDLEIGEVVTADDLSTRSVPVDYVPADAVTPENYHDFLSRMVRAPIRAGVPLSAGSLVPLYSQFSRVIGPGKVGYTLEVDEKNSISGMISPGDKVDILMTFNPEEDSGNKAAKPKIKVGERVVPLLANIAVLATGRRVGETEPGEDNQAYSSITLELDPKQAEQLAIGKKMGEIHVLLRNIEDTTSFGLTGLTEKALIESAGGKAADDVEYIIGGGK